MKKITFKLFVTFVSTVIIYILSLLWNWLKSFWIIGEKPIIIDSSWSQRLEKFGGHASVIFSLWKPVKLVILLQVGPQMPFIRHLGLRDIYFFYNKPVDANLIGDLWYVSIWNS